MNAETHLLSVFPAAVWRHILERTNDPKTQRHIIAAFPELREHFGRKLVAKCLFAEVLHLIAPQLSIQDVLNCRQACSMWHRNIHTLLSNYPNDLPFLQNPRNTLSFKTLEINRNGPLFLLARSFPVLHFRTAEQINRFLEMQRNQNFPDRKIFGGAVFLDPSPGPSNPRELYEQSSLKLLKMFAPEIQYLTLSSDSEFETLLQYLKRQTLSLQLTPKLKKLCLNMEKRNDADTRDLVGPPPLLELELYIYKDMTHL